MNIESNMGSENERLMAYLYDELSAEEKKSFEEELKSNADLKEKLETLRQTRKVISSSTEQKVSAPPFTELIYPTKKAHQASPIKWVASVAASLLILLLSAKLMGLSVVIDENGTAISFNQTVNREDYIRKDQVDQMIQSSLASYEEKMDQKIDSREQKQTQLFQTALTNNQKIINTSLQDFKQDNKHMMMNYFNQNTAQQQQYMSSLMSDYTNYVEQRRSEDMQYVLAKINLLETDNDLLELETNQLKNTYAMNTEESTY